MREPVKDFLVVNGITFYRPSTDPGPEAWVCLVAGRRVQMRSGKQLWRVKGHAKNALKYHVECSSYRGRMTLDDLPYEIITLADWEKRGRP